MRERTVLILAALTLPALALAVLLPSPGAGTMSANTANVKLLPSLQGHLDALAKLTITGPDGTVTLSRSPVVGKPAQGWTLREKGGYPVLPATIRPVIDGLAALHGVARKTDRPALHPRLDLADPGHGSAGHLVSLADGASASLGGIILGKQKEASGPAATGGIYARLEANAQAWLAEPAISLPPDALGWIDHSIIDIEADRVKEVVLSQPGTAPLDFARDKAEAPLTIRGLPSGTKLKSETPGADIGMAFHALDLQDVKPARAGAGTPAGSVHLVTFDNLVVDIMLAKENGQTWATLAATGAGESGKIAARTRGWAYELAADRATTLATKLPDLLQPAAPAPK